MGRRLLGCVPGSEKEPLDGGPLGAIDFFEPVELFDKNALLLLKLGQTKPPGMARPRKTSVRPRHRVHLSPERRPDAAKDRPYERYETLSV